MVARVEIAPDVLKWARERADVPFEELARKFKKYSEWEEGQGGPTYNQLETLANVVKLPVGMLFLPGRPEEQQLPLPDFRRMADEDRGNPSTELIDTIHTAQLRQDWYRAHLLSEAAPEREFVGSADLGDDQVMKADEIRKALGLEVGERSGTGNWSEFLRVFINQVRQAGILVMVNGVVGNNTRRKLNPREFRGFAIADPVAPLIFINGADTKAGQIFTLAHEVAHIWLGQTGISHVRPNHIPTENEIEAWCNKVAAEVLVPMATLETMFISDSIVQAKSDVARTFRVSTLVALRRLWELGRLDDSEFQQVYAAELDDLKQRDASKQPGGNFYNTMGARVDPTFAAAIIGSALEGTTLIGEALNLLNLKSTNTLRIEAIRLGILSDVSS